MNNRNKIEVWVYDYNNQSIKKAKVKVSSGNYSADLKRNTYSGAYELFEFKPDRYVISVSAPGKQSDERSLFVGTSGASETFILGNEEMPYFYRGTVKVPLEPINDSFGVVLQSPESKSAERIISQIGEKNNLKRLETHENYVRNGLYVFEYPKKSSEEEKQKFREAIQKQKGISLVAPFLKLYEKNATLLTDEIIVKFKSELEEKEVKELTERFGLRILRSIPYAGNTYHFKVLKGNNYELLAICNRLVASGLVEYAEPNLFHTVEEDTITPNNFLFAEQWDHQIIGTPNAWQVVNDALGAAQKFGSPNVYVAVVDQGVDPTHLQFSGTVSNGQPKMVNPGAYDFANMAANNNSLGGSHGTCCASASTGFTSTSSGSTGVPDGTVGIAGNCRVMGIRHTGPETKYADMYIWIAGFNPNSAIAGFPAQLARGADIITNSFGTSIGSPISGLMKDTFDFLTTYGRGGKGVILTFSVGNYSTNSNFHLSRPWAAYAKNFACGASTLANDGVTEVISAYSGSGTMLDFSAPSHDAYVSGGALHNPPANYGAFSGTQIGNDGNTPRNREIATTLSSNAAVGATSLVANSVTGMTVGQALVTGAPGTAGAEAKLISAINTTTKTLTINPALFNAHSSSSAVNAGRADYKNNFGGTSYATPVIAGTAALMLSLKPNLTYTEVCEILRATAVKIDPNNTNAVGRWVDTMGRISTDPAYTGPFFSQFYGYGRINVLAAVTAVRDYNFARDIYVRDNMSDAGTTTSGSPFWTGVDIWVRNNNDGVAPANYSTDANTVHQSPISSQSNWLNVRYKNRGTVTSYPFYIRAYIAHYPSSEFIYPDNFIPTVRPNGTIPNPLTFGTYLISEQLVNPVNAGQNGSVVMEWTQNLIPPKEVIVGGIAVRWHPCILVEVSPHDGFTPTGNHVWDDNNLAQKNLSIVYPDSSDLATFVMLGNEKNKSKLLRVDILRRKLTNDRMFLHFPDAKVTRLFKDFVEKNPKYFESGKYREAAVFWLKSSEKVSFEIPNIGLISMVIGVEKPEVSDDFTVDIQQYSDKKLSGSYGVEFRSQIKG